jgi:two-component system, cell cycle response regulator
MSEPHKIALHGFTAFERATFESFFRLAARRAPGYQLVADPGMAALTVVNSDDAVTLKAVIANKPSPHVLLVGATDGGTGWMLQNRPLNLMRVLTMVEQLLGTGSPAVPQNGFAATQSFSSIRVVPTPAQTSQQPLARTISAPAAVAPPTISSSSSPLATSAPAPLAPAHTPALQGTAPMSSKHATAQQLNSVRTGTADFSSSRMDSPVLGMPTKVADFNTSLDYILVVDDSDIALKFMRNRLTRFGFSTDLVSSGEEALGRMNIRPYKFVFLDVMMEGLDGYQTCRAIKQRKYTEGKPPVVVMLTSRGGTIDKIRGTLAGCDAYLTKPLNERDLIAVLAKHDRTVARGFQETNLGGRSTRSSTY